MRYVAISLAAAIALGFSVGCTNQSVVEATHAARYLDGKVVTDKEGCVYTVTQYNDIGSAVVHLRFVAELSSETCTLTIHDAS